MIIILHNSHFQILYLARTTLEDFSVLCEKRGRQPKYITPSDHQRLHKRRVETKQKLMQIKTRFGTPSPIIHYPLTPASAELAELMLRGSLSLALLRLSIFPYFYISYFYISYFYISYFYISYFYISYFYTSMFHISIFHISIFILFELELSRLTVIRSPPLMVHYQQSPCAASPASWRCWYPHFPVCIPNPTSVFFFFAISVRFPNHFYFAS